MSKYEWNEAMGEISGFGGSYEAACRAMVIAGCEWLDAHPEAVGVSLDESDRAKELSVIGADATTLETVIIEAANASGKEAGWPFDEMVHAVVNHLMFIRKNGWDRYCAELIDREAKDQGATA